MSQLLWIVQRVRRQLIEPEVKQVRRPLIEPETTSVVAMPPAPPVADKPATQPEEISAPLSALDQALKKLSEADSKN